MLVFKDNRRYLVIAVILGIIVISSLLYGFSRLKKQVITTIPQAKNLNVPFTDQAPKANWQEPWLDACEETSIIMADNFYKNTKITPDQAKQQILAILAVKDQHFGVSKDESMERIAEIVNLAKLPWKAVVSVNPLLNDIKKEIAQGHPVIAPIDPSLLKNSPYTGDSLKYHVLIISGYDDKTKKFIVQDPGSTGGKNNTYDYQNFYDAINDYLPNDSPSGRKAVLFTSLN